MLLFLSMKSTLVITILVNSDFKQNFNTFTQACVVMFLLKAKTRLNFVGFVDS